MPEIIYLDSGYIKIHWTQQCWAQIPKDFNGDIIPDQYIFNPEWNSTKINDYWKQRNDKSPDPEKEGTEA